MVNIKTVCLPSAVVLVAYLAYIQIFQILPTTSNSIDELAESLGVQLEHHTVTTEDGYILEMHRIPNAGKPPIFLMHCLLCSSCSWLLIGNKSLPLYLARRGFDVWLGNARGNTYSRKHVTLDPDANAKAFFDFSWHEIGAIDVPTMIDYVLAQTKHEKLYYAGHSQGALSFYVMMSERPEYNHKVEVMFALAPVVYTKEIKSFAFNVPAKFQQFFEWFTPLVGLHELFPRSQFWMRIANIFCHDGSWTQQYCYLPFGLVGGFNYAGFNATLFPLVYTHLPSGSSTNQLLHYTQVLNSDIFRQYDHGGKKNVEKYGQETPPLYHLNRTNVPVVIFWAGNDFLTTERNIEKLHHELSNVVHRSKVPIELFNHSDFYLSFLAEEVIFPEILRMIAQYSNNNVDRQIHKN